jgi:hypothetical protein
MSKIKTNQKVQKVNSKDQKSNLEKMVMQKIKSGQVKMKPKWLFVLGSVFMSLGFISFTMVAVFLTNLTVFLIRKKGPGIGRLNLMLDNFPLWIPLLAVLGIVLGIWFLKKYDFSYKKNFWFVIVGFIASILLAAFVMDYLGLNETWSRGGTMRRFYQRIENQENLYPDSRVRGVMQDGQGRGYSRNR